MIPLGGPMTGEEAQARARAALLAFDVKGPFRTQALGRYGPGLSPQDWTVTLSAPDGRRYTTYFWADGSLNAVDRAGAAPRPKGPLLPADAARMARWLAKVRPRFPVRPWTAQDYAGGRFYEAVVAGHPFVDPRFLYVFTVDRGAFAGLRIYGDPPPTGPSLPRVSRASAERAADAYFASLRQPGRVEWLREPKLTRLAWLETDGPTARLVWELLGSAHILGGSWTKSPGAVWAYYDAVTGERRERRRR